MNRISQIRARLGVTQKAMADALAVSQGNVSHYERGQNMPSEIAKRLITYSASCGVALSFDDIYGNPASVLGSSDTGTVQSIRPEHSQPATGPKPETATPPQGENA